MQELLSEIDRISKIVNQYDEPSMIPKIERDLLLSALRDLYEKIVSLPDTIKTIQEPGKIIHAEKQSPEEVKEEDEMIEFIDEQPAEEKIPETTFPVDQAPESKAEKNKDAGMKEKEKVKTLADKFKGNSHSIYETLSEKTPQQNISSKLQSRPIADIAAAIGVNDRFKLIKDLFSGDAESYKKTIETLNNSNNFNEAFNFISTNFNWDMENESVQYILDLVRRKFIVDKNE